MGTDKKDLTRIEDLQEFVHEGDTQVEAIPNETEEMSHFEQDNEEVEFPVIGEESGPPAQDNEDFPTPPEVPLPEIPTDEITFDNETLEDDMISSDASLDDSMPDEDSLDAISPEGDTPLDEETSDVALQEDSGGFSDLTPKDTVEEEQLSETLPKEEQPDLQNTLEDIQQFSTHLTYGQLSLGQGPPFAVAIRNIRDEETKNELRRLLGEMGLEVGDFEQGLALGSLLVGQINEYCAIFLAHKLRNLDVEIELGLASSIHLPKNYEDEAKRGIPKDFVKDQSREEGQNLDEWKYDDFFISTTSHHLDPIKEYLGPIQAVRKISSEQLAHLPDIQDINLSEKTDYQDYLGKYHGLLEELKNGAIKRGAHALIQLSFQLTPLTTEGRVTSHQLLAMGNLVRF